MARKLILKEDGLNNSGSAPTGYKYFGDVSGTLSQKIGGTVSGISSGGGNSKYTVTLNSVDILSGGVQNLWTPTYVSTFPLIKSITVYFIFGTTAYSHLDLMSFPTTVSIYGHSQTFTNTLSIHNVSSDFISYYKAPDSSLSISGGFNVNFGANAPTLGDGVLHIVFEYSDEPFNPSI